MRPAGFSLTPRFLGAIGALLAFLIIGGYTLLVALPLIEGPSLVISEPDGTAITGAVTIAGKTNRVSFLSINGLPVAVSEDGSFSVKRTYPAGYTEVTVQAKDRFGRERTRSISFITSAPMTEATSTNHGIEEKK
jgi:hypothetical protein